MHSRGYAQPNARPIVPGAPRAEWLPVPGLLLRNTVFLAIVLLHGFRRLLPPY